MAIKNDQIRRTGIIKLDVLPTTISHYATRAIARDIEDVLVVHERKIRAAYRSGELTNDHKYEHVLKVPECNSKIELLIESTIESMDYPYHKATITMIEPCLVEELGKEMGSVIIFDDGGRTDLRSYSIGLLIDTGLYELKCRKDPFLK